MSTTENAEKKESLRRPIRLLKCLITGVALSGLLIGGIAYFNVYLPQGKGPAGPDVPKEPFKHVWSEKNVMLFGFGDDITDGFDVGAGFSYFERLVKNPVGDSCDMSGKNLSVVFPNLTAKNIAFAGSTSIQNRAVMEQMPRQPQNVLGIVVLTTGSRDIIHSYGQRPPEEGAMYGAAIEQALPWIDNFPKRLDELVGLFKDVFPGGCQIFIANIPDLFDSTGNSNAWFSGLPAWPDGVNVLESYNQVIAQCAAKYDNVHLVDIHTSFLGHGIHCRKFWIKNYRRDDPTYWFQPKNIADPGERGHDAIRRLFLNEMIKVFCDANDGNKAN